MDAAVEIKAANAKGETSAIVTLAAISQPAFLTARTAVATSGESFSYPVPEAQGIDPFRYYYFDPYTYDPSGRNAPPLTVAAQGLPPGLFYNPATQAIEGTPTATGDFEIRLIASRAGSDTETKMLLHVSEADAARSSRLRISSGVWLTRFGAIGSPFKTTVWSDGFASNVEATGLPPGVTLTAVPTVVNGTLTLAASLEGKPTEAGVFPAKVTFSDGEKSASAIVTIVIPAEAQPPSMSSSFTADGTAGEPFFYYIYGNDTQLQNSPIRIEADDLPAGIEFDTGETALTGTPQSAGTFVVPFRLTNSGGTSEAFVTIHIADPVNTSPRLTAGTDGDEVPASKIAYADEDFEFTLRSKSPVLDMAVSGLPAGFGYETLEENGEVTGVRIFGSPSDTEVFLANITATGAEGVTKVPLTIDVRKFDAIDDIPTPTPTPAPPKPGKRIALHLRAPSVVRIEKPNCKILGKLSRYSPGAATLFARIDRGWTKLAVAGNGRFRLKLRDLAPGRTVVSFRLLQDGAKPSTRKIRILRKSAE